MDLQSRGSYLKGNNQRKNHSLKGLSGFLLCWLKIGWEYLTCHCLLFHKGKNVCYVSNERGLALHLRLLSEPGDWWASPGADWTHGPFNCPDEPHLRLPPPTHTCSLLAQELGPIEYCCSLVVGSAAPCCSQTWIPALVCWMLFPWLSSGIAPCWWFSCCYVCYGCLVFLWSGISLAALWYFYGYFIKAQSRNKLESTPVMCWTVFLEPLWY